MGDKKAVVVRTERYSPFSMRFIFDEPATLNNGDTLSMTWGAESNNLVGEFVITDATNELEDIAIRLTRSNDEPADTDAMLDKIREVAALYGFKISQFGSWKNMTASAVAEKEYTDRLLARHPEGGEVQA